MSSSIIDARLGIERTFGLENIWRGAVTELMAELPGALDEISGALAEQRVESLRLTLHRLYGTTLYSGTPELQDAAHALVQACANSPEQMDDGLAALKLAAARLNAHLAAHGIPEV